MACDCCGFTEPVTLRQLGETFSPAGCESCKAPTVLRINNYDRTLFWGCSTYPDCRKTVPFSLPGTKSTESTS